MRSIAPLPNRLRQVVDRPIEYASDGEWPGTFVGRKRDLQPAAGVVLDELGVEPAATDRRR